MTRARDLSKLADGTEFTAADHSKLDAIEASATADQTDAEIRAAVEAASDSNVFTDADHSKLNAIEASSDVTDTANVTAAGALMDSELTNLAAVKAINQSLVTTATPTFAGMGINTATPLSTLQVRDSGSENGSLRVGGSGASLGLELTYNQSGATTSIIQANPTYTNAGQLLKIRADGDANPDQLVLTGAGNVLVGTTESSPWDGTTSGIALRHEGFISAASSGSPAELNRLGSDGNIINLRKDGTTVGSIGSQGSGTELYIAGSGTNTSGIYFTAANQAIPMKAGGLSNGTQDIGKHNFKWKDIYLSGGVYLGGTGAANKLDDYEVGTATMIWTGTGTSSSAGTWAYTKVGRLVTMMGTTPATIPNPTGALQISGLPFTVNGAINGNGSILYRNITAPSNMHTLVAYTDAGGTAISPYWSGQGNYAQLNKSDINTSGTSDMYWVVSYIT